MPDANCYTSMRGTIASAPDNDAYTAPAGFGYLHFGILNTITTGSGGMSQNTGNMVTRDWNFFGALGSEFTTSPLTVDAGCSQTSTSCTVNMSGWRMTWNGVPSINIGAGAPAVLAANDGIWGNGNDTLDYFAVIPAGDPSSLGGVSYTLHLVGSYTTVPVPPAVWFFASGSRVCSV